jgi:sarcosine oxidase subunit gamma
MADVSLLQRSPLKTPFVSMVSIRVDPDSGGARGIEGVLGTTLPRTCGVVTRNGAHSVLWLGPDEWLVVSEGGTADIAGDLRAATAGSHAAVVDVSANRTVLELSGAHARDVLEKGCPVDLHPRAFADDTAVTTTLARVPVLLWKVDATLYRILPRSSFAPYVASWLQDAMLEFAPWEQSAGGS